MGAGIKFGGGGEVGSVGASALLCNCALFLKKGRDGESTGGFLVRKQSCWHSMYLGMGQNGKKRR